MIQIQKIYDIFLKHPICTDSRNVKKEQLFIALKGSNFDGNQFAKDALDKGCTYAIVDDEKVCLDKRYIYVENSLELLQKLANKHRQKLGIPLLAITGTNGKTTTKELVNSILSRKYKTFATVGNLNNNIGVPLTLLSMKPDIEFGIVEMGANHEGEIEELCHIAAPDYGIITNVGRAHLEGFGSFETVKKTKSELYKYIATTSGTIFVNQNNSHLLSMLPSDSHVEFYGNKSLPSLVIEMTPFLKMSFKTNNGKTLSIRTNLIGKYNFENVLTAIAVGQYFHIPMSHVKNAIEDYHPINLRSQLKKTVRNTLIIDAYNANPASMAAAIETFSEINVPQKTVIIGDMLELGESAFVEHQKIIHLLTEKQIDNVLLVGKHFFGFIKQNNSKHFMDVSKLQEYLKTNPLRNNWILLKASRGIQLEKIIEYL